MFCDKLIAKTDDLCQPESRTAWARQPFPPSPSSSSYQKKKKKKKKKNDITTHQSKEFGSKDFLDKEDKQFYPSDPFYL